MKTAARQFLLLFLSFAVASIATGQTGPFKPKRCHSDGPRQGPKYRIGAAMPYPPYKGVPLLSMNISLKLSSFTRESMIALARQLDKDICKETRLDVKLLDDYETAKE